MEELSNLKKKNKPVRNSEEFEKWLKSIGKTYGDVYDILNRNGVTEFNNILDKDGLVKIADKEGYTNSRSYQASDYGRRKESETEIDCRVGNIQEALFCIDNYGFIRNESSTKNAGDISSTEDLIHKKSGYPVEFKVNYGNEIKFGNVIYRHRNGGFAKSMAKGKIIIVYYPYLGKVAILSKEYFGEKKSIKMYKEHELNEITGKYYDVVTIWEGILIDYKMFHGGNGYIYNKISYILGKRV